MIAARRPPARVRPAGTRRVGPAPPGRGRRAEAGVTFVEMIVVLAIVSVLLALVMNGWSAITERRLTGMARKIAADMRMIEQRARTERTCYRVDFSPVQDTYDILRYDGDVIPAPPGGGNQCPGGWPTTPVFKEDIADTVSRRMPPRTDLVSTTFIANRVTFSPTGNPNAGTVTIRGQSGQTKLVIVDVLGRVRIGP